MVAVSIEAFGRAMPTLVLACGRGVPGREVRQQRPRPAMQPARVPRAMKVLAVIEVAVHPAHQAIEHITGAVASGVMVRLRPTVAFATEVQDAFQNDPRQVLGRPFPERPEPRCAKLRRSGAWYASQTRPETSAQKFKGVRSRFLNNLS